LEKHTKNVIICRLQKKKIIIFIFLAVYANPTLLDYVIGANLVKFFLLLIGQGSRPLLHIGWGYLQILRRLILSLTNPGCLGLVRHQQKSDQILSLDNYTPHVISYDCKKGRQTQAIDVFFALATRNLYFLK
jgi:hypothetical protein